MFQKVHMPTCLLYGAIAAVAYSIPMIYFVYSASFADSWWLYVGNFLFMIVVAVFVLADNRKKRENVNTSLSLVSGHLVSVIGVVLSCIIGFIALNIAVPNLLGSGQVDKVLEQAPSQAQNGRTDGLALLLFMNAIIGNISAGSFVSIILPYTMKRNQTKETVISRVNVDPSRQ
jgi:hypothetical protein